MQDEMHRTKSVISEMLIELIDRSVNRIWKHLSGGDALRGHTRSHPEHDGYDLSGRWYYAGDGMGEQVAAGLPLKVIRVNG